MNEGLDPTNFEQITSIPKQRKKKASSFIEPDTPTFSDTKRADQKSENDGELPHFIPEDGKSIIIESRVKSSYFKSSLLKISNGMKEEEEEEESIRNSADLLLLRRLEEGRKEPEQSFIHVKSTTVIKSREKSEITEVVQEPGHVESSNQTLVFDKMGERLEFQVFSEEITRSNSGKEAQQQTFSLSNFISSLCTEVQDHSEPPAENSSCTLF